MRILLHRGFLKLVTLKHNQDQTDAINPAAKCVELACSCVEIITTSMNAGSSGILQAAFFGAIGYLWNATISLFLYLLSPRACEAVHPRGLDTAAVTNLVEAAIQFFSSHANILPFADVAAKKSRRLLDKAVARMATATDTARANDTVDNANSNIEDPNELLETFMILDAPLSAIDGTTIGDSFDGGLQYDLLHQQFDMSGWNDEDGESYTFFDQSWT